MKLFDTTITVIVPHGQRRAAVDVQVRVVVADELKGIKLMQEQDRITFNGQPAISQGGVDSKVSARVPGDRRPATRKCTRTLSGLIGRQ